MWRPTLRHSVPPLLFAIALSGCIDGLRDVEPARSDTPSPVTQWPDDPRERVYWNNSTAPSIIKVWLRDKETGRSCRTVTENPIFIAFMWEHWTAITEAPEALDMARYASFMVAHENKPIDVDLAAYFSRTYGPGYELDRETPWHSGPCFDRPYTLAELGMASERELLDAYFDFDHDKGRGIERRPNDSERAIDIWEPRLIALLIDSGYAVGRGDIAPFMYISKLPPKP